MWKEFKRYKSIYKEEGFKGLWKKGGWKLFLFIVGFYLIRDTILYILIPYAIFDQLSENNEIMMTGLLHTHSMLRYFVLIAILGALIISFRGMKGGKAWSKSANLFTVLAVVFVHVQLLVGLALYFFGDLVPNAWKNASAAMSNAPTRFFMVEHLVGMLIGIVLITIGRAKSKRQAEDQAKYKTVFIFFGLGFLVILLSIPWPFMPAARGWLPF